MSKGVFRDERMFSEASAAETRMRSISIPLNGRLSDKQLIHMDKSEEITARSKAALFSTDTAAS